MRRKYTLIVVSVVSAVLAVVAVVSAGDPNNPPGPPETTSSYTLEDIYDRLDTGAPGTPITFTEPSSGPMMGTMHTLYEIYNLIGKRAFVPNTGQTISYTVGDDGDLAIGVEWITSTRFVTATTGVVTDTLTGLVWLENANCWGVQVWATALTNVHGLANGSCGLTDGSSAGDWRLPNVRELQTLIDYGESTPALPNGHPFTGVVPAGFWSSSTYASNVSYAWYVSLGDGSVFMTDKASPRSVWAVRGGQ